MNSVRSRAFRQSGRFDENVNGISAQSFFVFLLVIGCHVRMKEVNNVCTHVRAAGVSRTNAATETSTCDLGETQRVTLQEDVLRYQKFGDGFDFLDVVESVSRMESANNLCCNARRRRLVEKEGELLLECRQGSRQFRDAENVIVAIDNQQCRVDGDQKLEETGDGGNGGKHGLFVLQGNFDTHGK